MPVQHERRNPRVRSKLPLGESARGRIGGRDKAVLIAERVGTGRTADGTATKARVWPLSEHHPRIPYSGQFRACYAEEAVALIGQKHLDLVIETRYRADEGVELFTSCEGTEYRAGSLHELIERLPHIQVLRILHTVPVEFEGTPKSAHFTEIHRPSRTSRPFEDTVKVMLKVDDRTFESPWTESVREALTELHLLDASWHFRTCMTCDFASHPSPYSNPDLEFWCYRDAPRTRSRLPASTVVDTDDRFAGQYWVRAFHRCASWRLRHTRSESQI